MPLNVDKHAPRALNYVSATHEGNDLEATIGKTLRGVIVFGPGVLEVVTIDGDTVTMTFGSTDLTGTAETVFVYPYTLELQIRTITANTTIDQTDLIMLF